MITRETLNTDYVPSPGLEYEVAEGCVRKTKPPFYDVQLAFDKLLFKEDLTAAPGDEGYVPTIRIQALEVISDGDKLPKGYKGVDMDIVGRMIADFFSFRLLRARQPQNSSA